MHTSLRSFSIEFLTQKHVFTKNANFKADRKIMSELAEFQEKVRK